ncbi:MAG: hypothetical protein ACE37H_16065 [Phycisphaeraceae bacterium]
MDEQEPLIKDQDPSTQGGPQRGLAFMIIVGVACAAVIIAGIIAIAMVS